MFMSFSARAGLLLLLSGWFAGSALQGGEAQAGFEPLDGAAPPPVCARGYEELVAGKNADAEKSFAEAAQADPKDAAARFGQCLIARLKGERQASVEFAAAALDAGHKSPWADAWLEWAAMLLERSPDPTPLLEAVKRIEEDPEVPFALRDHARLFRMDWLVSHGDAKTAAKSLKPLGFITRWALVGPFDNRDKAGFAVEYEPEKAIDLAKPTAGRNRKAAWFAPQAEPTDGVYDLPELFEPNIHVLVYAATWVQSSEDGWALVYAGGAGALKLWVNGAASLEIPYYNNFSYDKTCAPVYLHKGWNQLLVKSAVEENNNGWSFALRLEKLDGHESPIQKVDPSAEAAQAYIKEAAGWAPLNGPAPAADAGLVGKVEAALKKNPDSPWLLAMYGLLLHTRKLGEAEEGLDAKEVAKALERASHCAFFEQLLATVTDDPNQARQVLEQSQKDDPSLAYAYSQLCDLAAESGLDMRVESLAREAIKRFGDARAGGCTIRLAQVLQHRGFGAEALKLARQYTETYSWDSTGWPTRIELELSKAERFKALERALKLHPSDPLIEALWRQALENLGREREAAEFMELCIAREPLDIHGYLTAAQAWREAGDELKAAALLDRARLVAPENPELLEALGAQALRAGHSAEAEERWREALHLRPNAPQIKDWLTEISQGKSIDRAFFAEYEIPLKSLKVPRIEDFPGDHAVYLLNQEVVHVNANGTSSRMVHKIIKVLHDEGIEEAQSQEVFYDPSRQVVDVIRAAAISPDGKELARAEIADRSVGAEQGVKTKMYDEYHLKSITFKDIASGAIVDLQYTIRDTGENIYGDYFSESFEFGMDQPVVRAQYVLDLPANREFAMRAFHTTVKPEITEAGERKIVKWELRNHSGVVHEDAMPPLSELAPSVHVSTMKTWDEVGAWYWNLSKDALTADEALKKKVAEITAGAKTPTEKLRAIYEWVVGNVRYLGIEFGRNGFKPHRAPECLKALYGDCKDTASLLTSMLSVAGIESRLVLVRTTDDGLLPEDALPAPMHFNHCIAFVPDVEGKPYWLDGTASFFQLGEVPAGDEGAQVLVISPGGGKFVRIPRSPAEANGHDTVAEVKVGRDGSGTLSLEERVSGQNAPVYREAVETPGKFKEYVQERGAKLFSNAELQDLKHGDSQAPGPFKFESRFKVPALATKSGEKLALRTSLDPLNLTRDFVTGTERDHPLEIEHAFSKKETLRYTLDDGLKAAALPEPAELKDEFARYKREVKAEGQTVTVTEEFSFAVPRVPPDQYKRFQEFCRKVDAWQDQRILIENK